MFRNVSNSKDSRMSGLSRALISNLKGFSLIEISFNRCRRAARYIHVEHQGSRVGADMDLNLLGLMSFAQLQLSDRYSERCQSQKTQGRLEYPEH